MRRRLVLNALAMPWLPASPIGLPHRAAAPKLNVSAVAASVSQYLRHDAGAATFALIDGGTCLDPSQHRGKAKA